MEIKVIMYPVHKLASQEIVGTRQLKSAWLWQANQEVLIKQKASQGIFGIIKKATQDALCTRKAVREYVALLSLSESAVYN